MHYSSPTSSILLLLVLSFCCGKNPGFTLAVNGSTLYHGGSNDFLGEELDFVFGSCSDPEEDDDKDIPEVIPEEDDDKDIPEDIPEEAPDTEYGIGILECNQNELHVDFTFTTDADGYEKK